MSILVDTSISYKARALPEYIPKTRLHPKACFLLDQALLEKGEPIAIGCSGGVDSVSLLLLIYAYYPQATVHVLHYNHNQRPESADKDALFVQQLAGDLGYFFYSQKREDPSRASEGTLREERLGFFHGAMEARGLKYLLLGHQRDDILETILMRLTRGSGLCGLVAPKAVQWLGSKVCHIRPLLSISKEQIVKTMQTLQLPWCEDCSNESCDYFRNRVRRVIIPALQEVAPVEDVFQTALHTHTLLEEDQEALNIWLESLKIDFESTKLSLDTLQKNPRALIRRILHRWLLHHGLAGHLTAQGFEQCLSKLACEHEEHRFKVSLGPDAFIVKEDPFLEIIKNDHYRIEYPPLPLLLRTKIYLPNKAFLMAEALLCTDEILKNLFNGKYPPSDCVFLNLSGMDIPLQVRPWQPGDSYKPLGAPGRRKLQDLFIDKKIPKPVRHRLPVITTAQGDIVWCPGLPVAEKFKLNLDHKRALRLTYRP